MKRVILFIMILIIFAFKTDDFRSDYNLPRAASSVTAGDIDMDGDNDIVVGHIYNFQTNWTGITIMRNESNGQFMIDSFYVNGNHRTVILEQLDSNPKLDLITQAWDNVNSQIGIIFNNDFDSSNDLRIVVDEYASSISSGDVNNDSQNDIVIASNDGQFWAVLYNDGEGNFSEPEYYEMEDIFPSDIACGDVDGNGRDDVVVSGQTTQVFFSYPDGFQSLILESNDFKDEASIADFDNDGDNDILTFVGIPHLTSLIMYENKGNGALDTLDEFNFNSLSTRFSITDFNNDSLKDILFLLGDKTGYVLWYNEGDFQLADSSFIPVENYGEGWRNFYCEDMDDNGFIDIITVRTLWDSLPDNLTILFNDGNGNFVDEPVNVPENYSANTNNKTVLSCYPNPFSTFTTFKIHLQQPAKVELSLYDLQGRKIISLTEKNQIGSSQFIQWDGLNKDGTPCKPGPYIAYLKVNGEIRHSTKIVKTK